MFKKHRFNIGLTLLVQSASFVILFFMLYRKKKNLANTFLALSAIGGITGAYLVLKEAKSEVEACEQAAKDAMEAGTEDDDFCFDECEGCRGECESCIGGDTDCVITVEEDPIEVSEEVQVSVDAEEPAAEAQSEEPAQPEAAASADEEVVEEEPAEDIFTEAAN